MVSYSSGWPQTQNAAEDDTRLLVFLPPTPNSRMTGVCRHAVYSEQLRRELRASYALGEHSALWTTAPLYAVLMTARIILVLKKGDQGLSRSSTWLVTLVSKL